MTSTLSEPNQLPGKLSASSKILLTVCTIAGFICLTGLGFWQLQRLSWKQDLMAKIELRMVADRRTFSEVLQSWKHDKDVEYYRIRVQGLFEHDKEIHFYTVDNSRPGWRILTPLKLDKGVRIFVDRGFVPLTHKNEENRERAQFSDPVEITGFVRRFAKKKGLFVPDNNLAKNEWYWKSRQQMSEFIFPERRVQIAPFFIESDDLKNPEIWPRGGVTRLNLPNRHLEYAITWFSLAVVLLIMYFLYLKKKNTT